MKSFRILFYFALGIFYYYSGFAQTDSTMITLSGGIISDACHGEICHGGISADLEAYDNTGKKIYSGRSDIRQFGLYIIEGLKEGETYKIVINDTSYLYREYKIIIPKTDKYRELSMDFLAAPKAIGVALKFHVPPFELRKSKIRFGGGEFLENYELIMKQNPKIYFEIECFPDDNNSPEVNLRLTVERCTALKDYYTARGIKADRIRIKPNHEVDPLLPPPPFKIAKGKRYIGTTYLRIVDY